MLIYKSEGNLNTTFDLVRAEREEGKGSSEKEGLVLVFNCAQNSQNVCMKCMNSYLGPMVDKALVFE